jgi:hypothetical protein
MSTSNPTDTQNIPQNEKNNEINNPELQYLLQIPCRLVVKNIPSLLSNDVIKGIFTKNFENDIKEEMLIIKTEKKYSLKKRNKLCFITVNNFDVRKKLFEFINEFELADLQGIKQKLTIHDCLFQKNYKLTPDELNNTLDNLDHFKKFKEYFEKDKILDFKLEEEKCKINILYNKLLYR